MARIWPKNFYLSGSVRKWLQKFGIPSRDRNCEIETPGESTDWPGFRQYLPGIMGPRPTFSRDPHPDPNHG